VSGIAISTKSTTASPVSRFGRRGAGRVVPESREDESRPSRRPSRRIRPVSASRLSESVDAAGEIAESLERDGAGDRAHAQRRLEVLRGLPCRSGHAFPSPGDMRSCAERNVEIRDGSCCRVTSRGRRETLNSSASTRPPPGAARAQPVGASHPEARRRGRPTGDLPRGHDNTNAGPHAPVPRGAVTRRHSPGGRTAATLAVLNEAPRGFGHPP